MGFPVPGGSVLVSCRIDDKASDGSIVPHGYVREFHLYADLIHSQLAQMFANGQRRLGIAVPYFETGDTFALDSSCGELTAESRANLTNLLKLATSIGFSEFLIEMIPEWSASYANWGDPTVMGQGKTRTFAPMEYGRDFAFTCDVWDAVQSTGVFARMDLIGEGADEEVCARFWADWCDEQEGTSGSVGFSMVPVQSSIEQYQKFYANGKPPDVLSVHAYNGPDEMSWPDWKAATAQWAQGYIIGESLCDNPEADAIFAASPDRYFYRLVWPLGSNDPSNPTQNMLTVNQKF